MASSASIRSLFIINKAGGLVYQREFTKNTKRSANDNLRLAGTFHGCAHAPRLCAGETGRRAG